MKKLLTVIGILLVIFIGMYIYKLNINKNNVSVSEVKQIEEYISKIYMWKEVTGEALPEFDDINNAPDIWVWEVIKQSLDKYELEYKEIQEKTQEIFGSDFSKEFPKEGTQFIYYDEEKNMYYTNGMGLDAEEDTFFIKKISKKNNSYEVEIVEYLVDYGNESMQDNQSQDYDLFIKNLNDEKIATVKSSQNETKIIEIVKENIDKFSIKKIVLKKDGDERIYVKQVHNLST